jgi:hypothetical protein
MNSVVAKSLQEIATLKARNAVKVRVSTALMLRLAVVRGVAPRLMRMATWSSVVQGQKVSRCVVASLKRVVMGIVCPHVVSLVNLRLIVIQVVGKGQLVHRMVSVCLLYFTGMMLKMGLR